MWVPGRITFETQGVRDASSLVASASKEALDSVRKIAIGQTLVPTHMSRDRFDDKSAYAAAAAAGCAPQLDLRSPLNAEAAAAGEARRGDNCNYYYSLETLWESSEAHWSCRQSVTAHLQFKNPEKEVCRHQGKASARS